MLATAVDILREEGAPGLTIERVAQRSGVARTTIYRHWPGRAELLFDAIGSLGHSMALDDSGDLVADLRAHLRDLSAALKGSTWAALLPTVIDASARDAGFAALARAFSASRRAPLCDRLDAAVASGQLPADLDTDVLAAQLTGPLFYRRFVSHQPVTGAVVDQVMRTTVVPLIRS